MANNLATLNDNFLDHLNDEDFDQLLDVTQNTSVAVPQNDLKKNTEEKEKSSKSPKSHWLNGNSSEFSLCKEISPSLTTEIKREGSTNKSKKFCANTGTSYSISNSVKNAPKKQSFYKPLHIGPSTSTSSALNDDVKFSNQIEKDARDSLSFDINSLQNQLQILQKEYDKLKEENFVKQGEVINLRAEIKRKETILESERVEHCMTLEAAERRGREKSSKSISDMEIKMKSLEKEIDKLQGNLLFKNQEVQELLSKCKRLELKQKPNSIESSPKRRKIDTKISPNKSPLNFASRFDFGDAKKTVKTAETQTEFTEKYHRRKILHNKSQRRLLNKTRKAFYIMSTCQNASDSVLERECTSRQSQSTLIAHMIASENASTSNANDSETNMIKQACNELDNILKETERKETSSSKGTMVVSQEAISWVKILSFAEGNETTTIEELKTLSRCLLALIEERIPNTIALISVLSSMTAVANRCSNIPDDISDCLVKSIRTCASQASSEEIVQRLLCALNSLLRFENFARKLCVNKPDKCLVRRICQLLHNSGKLLAVPRLTKTLTLFVTKLLARDPNSFHVNKDCNCSLNLLSSYVTQLFQKAEIITTDSEWSQLCCGIRALHLWQLKDPSWCDKTPHVCAYTPLLSLIVRNAQYLKTRGILKQQTWDLLYDLQRS